MVVSIDPAAPRWLASRVPDALRGASVLGLQAWQWLGLLLAFAAALVLGGAGAFVIGRVGGRIAARTAVQWDDELLRATRMPLRFFIGVLAFRLLVVWLELSPGATLVVNRVVAIATIDVVAWLVIRTASVVADAIERRSAAEAGDGAEGERRARGVKTQVHVIRRIVNVTVVILATALILMEFDVVRSVGVSLLASAGIAGVVLGLAAQKTLAGVLAGIQLTVTQPIRIGDVVIVEGEWGTIEEITLTYVIVKVWDERRLIVPITRFLEQPFQNWTMMTPDLLGTIFFYVDWTFPVDAMRVELERIVKAHPLWDGRVQSVCVTNAKETTLEVRALVSAADASRLWDLRVDVRERVVRWLQELEGGRYLPRVRLGDERAHAGPARPKENAAQA